MDRHEPPRSESLEQLALLIFTDLHKTIISHETGSLVGDIDSVHDMRVSVRRLRVALSNFAVCMPKEERKRLRSSLENLADALGGVRDMDVMIAAMKDWSPTRHSHQHGREKAAVSALIARLRARRRSRLRALMNYLGGEEYAGFKLESPSDWVCIDTKSRVSNTSDSESARTLTEEEHGQAA
ncbi:MAG: CHAD domain-containing protein [Chloracidobacterium sp.]|nr:CHAD domain-containing protein [Chloracidobacterium sp.]